MESKVNSHIRVITWQTFANIGNDNGCNDINSNGNGNNCNRTMAMYDDNDGNNGKAHRSHHPDQKQTSDLLENKITHIFQAIKEFSNAKTKNLYAANYKQDIGKSIPRQEVVQRYELILPEIWQI